MVPNTSEVLPDPETPVNTVSRRFGISTLTSLRLFSRAPCTRITSWLSAPCGAGLLMVSPSVGRSPDGSAQLLDADHVAGGVADGEVAHPVGLVDRLLDDLGVSGLHPREGAVEVFGGQDDDPVGALGHHLGDRAALVV